MRLYQPGNISVGQTTLLHNYALASELAAPFCSAIRFDEIALRHARNTRSVYFARSAGGTERTLEHGRPDAPARGRASAVMTHRGRTRSGLMITSVRSTPGRSFACPW